MTGSRIDRTDLGQVREQLLEVLLLFDDPDDSALNVFRTNPKDLLHLEDCQVSDLVNGDHRNLIGVELA